MSEGAEIIEHLRRLSERRSVHPQTAVTGIFGSSRKDGNTRVLTDAVFQYLDDARLIDLSGLSIAPYDYDHAYGPDDFLTVANDMAQSQAIIFASPVYWYSMSAQMKLFFDRLTDLTKTHKELGRRLAGKTAFVIATGGGKTPPPSFEAPFAGTAGYFKMRWGGMLHESLGEDRLLTPEMELHVAAFAKKIRSTFRALNSISMATAIAGRPARQALPGENP